MTRPFEALLRWCDNCGTIQPPSDFIALAIEFGLIDPITRFVTGEAITALERLDVISGPTSMSIKRRRQTGKRSAVHAIAGGNLGGYAPSGTVHASS